MGSRLRLARSPTSACLGPTDGAWRRNPTSSARASRCAGDVSDVAVWAPAVAVCACFCARRPATERTIPPLSQDGLDGVDCVETFEHTCANQCNGETRAAACAPGVVVFVCSWLRVAQTALTHGVRPQAQVTASASWAFASVTRAGSATTAPIAWRELPTRQVTCRRGGCGGGIAVVGRVPDAACQTRLHILATSECARRVAHPKRPLNAGQVTRRQTDPGSRGRCARRRPRTRSRARSACGPASGCTSCPPTTTPCSCSTASQSTGWAWIGETAHLGRQARDVRGPPHRNALRPHNVPPARHECVSRLYRYGNSSYSVDSSGYQLEMALHEMMLQSPHRTLDPEVRRRGRRPVKGPRASSSGSRGALTASLTSFAASLASCRSPTHPPAHLPTCRKPTFSMCLSTPVA